MIWVEQVSSQAFYRLSSLAQRFYLLAIVKLTDDYGRFRADDLEFIAHEISPEACEPDILMWIQECIKEGLLQRYQGLCNIEPWNGEIVEYLEILNWDAWQTFSAGKRPAECPNPHSGLFEPSQNINCKAVIAFFKDEIKNRRWLKYIDYSYIRDNALDELIAACPDVRDYTCTHTRTTDRVRVRLEGESTDHQEGTFRDESSLPPVDRSVGDILLDPDVQDSEAVAAGCAYLPEDSDNQMVFLKRTSEIGQMRN